MSVSEQERIERLQSAFSSAIAQRGKNKGKLKSKCPPMGTDAAIAWQALQMNMNPYKVGMGHLMFMRKEQQSFYQDCLGVSDRLYSAGYRLDRDQVKLNELGIW